MEINEIRKYCLNCKLKPCSNKGCPLHNNIPEFIHEEDEEKAFYILSQTTVLPAVCSRICQSSKQCKGACVRGIKGESVSINEMEKHLADNAILKEYKLKKNKANSVQTPEENNSKQEMSEKQEKPNIQEQNIQMQNIQENKAVVENEFDKKEKTRLIKKVAVIGGGPSGLTAAAFLAMENVEVTIFEKNAKLGGLLEYGIPDFRLDRTVVKNSIDKIIELGIKVKTNVTVRKRYIIRTNNKRF